MLKLITIQNAGCNSNRRPKHLTIKNPKRDTNRQSLFRICMYVIIHMILLVRMFVGRQSGCDTAAQLRLKGMLDPGTLPCQVPHWAPDVALWCILLNALQ